MALVSEDEKMKIRSSNSELNIIHTSFFPGSFLLCNVFYFLENLQVRVSGVLTNAPFMLNLDCDHYINNSKAVRESMCFLMDPQIGRKVCYVQFPQRFDGIDRHDRYANRNTVFFDVSFLPIFGKIT